MKKIIQPTYADHTGNLFPDAKQAALSEAKAIFRSQIIDQDDAVMDLGLNWESIYHKLAKLYKEVHGDDVGVSL